MFAILARLQVSAVGDAVYGGRATAGFVHSSDEGSQALSSALEAASGGGRLGMSDSAFASKLIISPELLSKEKQKAKNGYCETALWNCTDLCGCSISIPHSHLFVSLPAPCTPGAEPGSPCWDRQRQWLQRHLVAHNVILTVCTEDLFHALVLRRCMCRLAPDT